MIRLLLADDRVLFRQGLASLLSLELDLNIIAEANNGQEAIALSDKFQPDIILMDVRMPICNGVEATNVIHQRYPWIRILVLTTFDEDEYVLHSLQAGALGYILKSTPSPQIVTAIRNLHQGYSQLGPTIAPKVFSQLKPPSTKIAAESSHNLSDRETEILKLLAQGKNNREISQTLHLTEGTIKNYLTNIFCQLGMRDRTQAALWAQKHLLR
jgi:DNA-binding NarL/FixJ family response regulator